MTTYTRIVDQIKHQFPAFYKEQGPEFIAFLEAYYAWLENESGILYTRKLFDVRDIDDTFVRFLDNFKYKYMHNLPKELLGDQRLLQKHILELYRSKGSDAGLALLFRLLFNEDVKKYIPSYDIFKTSDNTWIEPHYIEVTESPIMNQYNGQPIHGAVTGATAIVESVEQKYIDGTVINILLISGIKGNFALGEKVLLEVPDIINAPVVKGSITNVSIITSSANFKVGDVLTSTIGEKPAKISVASTYLGTGILEFNVIRGGTYYSMNAEITLSQGANTTGAGAQVKVGSLKDTFQYVYNTDKLLPYKDIDLDGIYPFPSFPTANSNTIINTCLNHVSITVGTIKTLLVLNPGSNYDDYVTVTAIDPYTSTNGIKDANNVQVGTNAFITGTAIHGDGLIGSAKVLSSGYNLQDYNQLVFLSNDGTGTATATIGLSGVGYDEGHYDNTKSFLSDDKYLFDGHYYQDFSYVVRAARNLDTYIEILKEIYHPAGNAVFGDVYITVTNNITNDIIYANLVKKPI